MANLSMSMVRSAISYEIDFLEVAEPPAEPPEPFPEPEPESTHAHVFQKPVEAVRRTASPPRHHVAFDQPIREAYMFPGILAQSDQAYLDVMDACAEHEIRQAQDDFEKEEALRDQDILDATMAAAWARFDRQEAWNFPSSNPRDYQDDLENAEVGVGQLDGITNRETLTAPTAGSPAVGEDVVLASLDDSYSEDSGGSIDYVDILSERVL